MNVTTVHNPFALSSTHLVLNRLMYDRMVHFLARNIEPSNIKNHRKTYYKTLIRLSKQVRYFTQISVWIQEKPFMQYSIIKFVRQMVEKY